MIVEVVNKSDFPLPEYKTKGSAGMDLRADLKRMMAESPEDEGYKEHIVKNGLYIPQFKVMTIPTGIFMALPDGGGDLVYRAEVVPRSGLASKAWVSVVNTPGTVDEDYRGEVKVIIICFHPDGVYINHGDRIAQMVISQAIQAEWAPVAELKPTARGTKGFGSTGTK